MPTKALPLALSALALACHAHLAGAATASLDSPYRLHIADPQDFRLRQTARDEYRLAKPYRAAVPQEAPAGDPVNAALVAAARADMETQPFARQIDRAATAANLDPALVHALIHVESRHHDKALSVKGAVGLMQVLPDTAARYGIRNLTRADQNLKAGTRYLRALMDQFDGRLELVLAAYNAGEGAVISHAGKIPPYRETRDYVKAVLAKYAEWRGPMPAGAAASPAPYGGLASLPPAAPLPPLPPPEAASLPAGDAPALIAYVGNHTEIRVLR
ncbi:MAG TPA: lytic transglycosylase domain-containing protein [Burkholderiales bacterium]|nr:lytic transglycosylase domain-containing protein [Burkholderiales bacterium]